jgi:hypothetical protein
MDQDNLGREEGKANRNGGLVSANTIRRHTKTSQSLTVGQNLRHVPATRGCCAGAQGGRERLSCKNSSLDNQAPGQNGIGRSVRRRRKTC